jgi:hypothetical protein
MNVEFAANRLTRALHKRHDFRALRTTHADLMKRLDTFDEEYKRKKEIADAVAAAGHL